MVHWGRLPTTEHGNPGSLFTVVGGLGHRDTGLIESIRGHLLDAPRRGEAAEYSATVARKIGAEASA